MCSRCQNAWESIGHALFSCTHARAVWKHTNFQLDFRRAYSMYKGDYIIHMAGLLDKAEFEAFICIMWCIWNSRNAKLHGHSVRTPSSQAEFGMSYIVKYHSVKQQLNIGLQGHINVAGTSQIYKGPDSLFPADDINLTSAATGLSFTGSTQINNPNVMHNVHHAHTIRRPPRASMQQQRHGHRQNFRATNGNNIAASDMAPAVQMPLSYCEMQSGSFEDVATNAHANTNGARDIQPNRQRHQRGYKSTCMHHDSS